MRHLINLSGKPVYIFGLLVLLVTCSCTQQEQKKTTPLVPKRQPEQVITVPPPPPPVQQKEEQNRLTETKKFKVTLLSQKANTSELSKILITYAVPKAGSVLADLSGVIDELTKKLFGGVGVTGKLLVNGAMVEFKPGFLSSYLMKNIETIRIPMNEIDSVSTERYMLVTKMVVIHTWQGKIKFNAGLEDWYNPFKYNDGQIKDLINGQLLAMK